MSASIAALSSVDIASESRDKEGDHLAVVPFTFRQVAVLRSELGDAGRPVAKGRTRSGRARRSCARPEVVVASRGADEPSSPCRVVAVMSDVFARDPDRDLIDG